MSTKSNQTPNSGPSYYKKLVDDFHERLASLDNYDVAAEIDSYCDDLECQVALTFDSVVKNLHQEQERVMGEIKAYREKRLAQRRQNLRPAKRMKFSATKERAKDIEFRRKILQFDVESFEHATSGFKKDPRDPSTKKGLRVKKALKDSKALNKALGELRETIRDDAFDCKFLKFRPSEWSIQHMNLLGKLEISRDEHDNVKPKYFSIIEISEKPYATLTAHSKRVISAKFLSNGLLVTCSADYSVRLWNRMTEQEKKLDSEYRGFINEIIELPDGRLIGGSGFGDIVLWHNANNAYKHIKCVCGHTQSIYSIQLLPNGNIATLSRDDTIKIWHGLEENELNELFTLNGHEDFASMSNRLVMLPNGFLVTCSNDYVSCKVIIWDPFQGKIVRKIATHLESVCSFTLLRNNELVLAPVKGPIQLINLDNHKHRRSLPDSERDGTCRSIIEMSNGHILLENPKEAERSLEIWNPESGELMQSVKSTHLGSILSISISPDRRTLVTTSDDSTVKFWKLNCFTGS